MQLRLKQKQKLWSVTFMQQKNHKACITHHFMFTEKILKAKWSG